jgi:hypothetical protein
MYPPNKKKKVPTIARIKEKNETWLGVIDVLIRCLVILVDRGLFRYRDIGPSVVFFKVAKSLVSAFLNVF